MNKDMTVGSPGRVMAVYALPMIVSVIFQQLYNIADSVIAGKAIGDAALAAVGASYPVTTIYTAFAIGINIGASIVISRYFGAREYDKLKSAASTALISSAVIAAILTVAGGFFCSPVLRLLKTGSEIFASSEEYLRIYTFGLIFVFVYNICTGVFSALGDSMTPLYLLVASSVMNVAADILFVTAFDMGVAGLAWATFVCQGIAGVFALVLLLARLRKMKSQRFKPFSFSMLGNISTLAVPSVLQQCFISLGNMFIQSVVNGYSTEVVAGYSAAIKLNTFLITILTTMSNAVSGFTAQNVGAGKNDRIGKGCRAGAAIMLAVVIPVTVLFVFFGDSMVSLFVKNESAGTIAVGATFLKIVAPSYIIAGVKLVFDGALRGAAPVFCFVTSTFTDLILRVALAYVFPKTLGIGSTGIWLAWPVGWAVSATLSCVFYFVFVKKNLAGSLPAADNH